MKQDKRHSDDHRIKGQWLPTTRKEMEHLGWEQADVILFTGDAINHHLWMQLDGCSSLNEYVKALDNIMFLEDRADLILHGHARKAQKRSAMSCF